MSKINKIKINDVSYDIEDLSVGNIDELSTNDKSSLVNAINEVFVNASSGGNPSSGGSSTTNYTTEEQVIGTWINGKKLYRKIIETNTPNEKGVEKVVATLPEAEMVLSITGNIYQGFTSVLVPVNYFFSSGNYGVTFFSLSNKSITMYVNEQAYTSCKATLIVEYTKTTD